MTHDAIKRPLFVTVDVQLSRHGSHTTLVYRGSTQAHTEKLGGAYEQGYGIIVSTADLRVEWYMGN